jgi:hypothetical protein
MIDNIQKITSLLEFKQGWVYEIFIIKNQDTLNILNYYLIHNEEELLNTYEDMKKIADLFDAKIYINLQQYSLEKLGFSISEVILNKLKNKNYLFKDLIKESTKNLSSEQQYWNIEINSNISHNNFLRIKTLINDCNPNGNHTVANIEGLNVIHLITKPFNTKQFMINQKEYYQCIINKNSIILLYYNDKEN